MSLHTMSANASCNASQLAVTLRVGTFNFGIHQDQLRSRRAAPKVLTQFERVVMKMTEEGALDMLFGCEVGGHKEGMGAENIDAKNVLKHALLETSHVETMQNYFGSFNLSEREFEVEAVRATTIKELPSPTLEPQLAVHYLRVKLNGVDAQSYMLVGNLHVRTPAARRTPGITARQSLVFWACRELEEYAEQYDNAVLLLVGDCNLKETDARAAIQGLQPGDDIADWTNVWQIKTAGEGRGGDVLFCRGANASSFDIPIGASYGATLGTRTLGLVRSSPSTKWENLCSRGVRSLARPISAQKPCH